MNHLDGTCNGQNDVDITELGIGQMEAVAVRLRDENIAAVYSSDLIRTRRGGKIIAEAHGLIPEHSSAFRELDFGLWEGLNIYQIEEQFPGALNERRRKIVEYKVPEGESVGDLVGRVIPAVKKILDAHHGKNVVLVAHGGVNRVILGDAMNLGRENFYSIEQDFGCLNVIDYFPGFTIVKLMNEKPQTR